MWAGPALPAHATPSLVLLMRIYSGRSSRDQRRAAEAWSAAATDETDETDETDRWRNNRWIIPQFHLRKGYA